MFLSVIVPFDRNLQLLQKCLEGLQPVPHETEIVVVADGARDDCHELASRVGARVIDIDGPSGPATARNRGADAAKGDVLVFVDSDVVAGAAALVQIRRVFQVRPDIAAVFGAYDENPPDAGFMSQYKNLSHSYVHRVSSSEAVTFWAGLGAIRARVFYEVGGFDERFRRPCVEDIDLGYRVTQAGHRILLDHRIRGTHLKRWTFRSSLVSDVRDRGIPWTQLLLRFDRLNNDLNLRVGLRVCVLLSYALVGVLALAVFNRWFLLAAVLCVAGLLVLNARYYAYFAHKRGMWFAVRVFGVHIVHHLCNGISYGVGALIHVAANIGGISLPGALPRTSWTGRPPASTHGTDMTART